MGRRAAKPLVVRHLNVKEPMDVSCSLSTTVIQVTLPWLAVAVRRAMHRVHCCGVQYLLIPADSTLPRLSMKRPNVVLFRLVVLIDRPPETTPPRVELSPVLIAHLPAALASSILPPLRKALIQVGPDNALI
jgi:hypothetical protein